MNPVWVGKGIILESVFLCSKSQYFCAAHPSISVQHISQYFPWISIECPDNWPLTGAEIFAICWNRLGVCAQTDRTSPQPPLAVWGPNSVMLADWSPNSTKWCHCLLYKFFAISCPLTNCYPANGASVYHRQDKYSSGSWNTVLGTTSWSAPNTACGTCGTTCAPTTTGQLSSKFPGGASSNFCRFVRYRPFHRLDPFGRWSVFQPMTKAGAVSRRKGCHPHDFT